VSFTQLANDQVVKAAQRGIEENPAAVIFYVDTFTRNCYYIIKRLSDAEVQANLVPVANAVSPVVPRAQRKNVYEIAIKKLKVPSSEFEQAFLNLLEEYEGQPGFIVSHKNVHCKLGSYNEESLIGSC